MTQTHDIRPVLVLGATGKVGARVAARLEALGLAVRRGSRTASVPFDWTEPATWGRVLDGASSAFVSYQPDVGFPGAAETISAFAREAVRLGTDRLVLLSGRGEPEAARSEATAIAAGGRWTVLRSSWFAQNFSEHVFVDAVRAGVIGLPVGDVPEPFVDVDDLADVAVAALTQPGHDGRTYELTGPAALTFTDVARILSDATGRTITYVQVSADEYVAGAVAAGLPRGDAEGLAGLFTSVLDGRNSHTTDDVPRVLVRPATPFADYATRMAATGVWDVSPVEARS
jgi:uncharacterized protein YbjT (DUF2867 family)